MSGERLEGRRRLQALGLTAMKLLVRGMMSLSDVVRLSGR